MVWMHSLIILGDDIYTLDAAEKRDGAAEHMRTDAEELTVWRARFGSPDICSREIDRLRDRLLEREARFVDKHAELVAANAEIARQAKLVELAELSATAHRCKAAASAQPAVPDTTWEAIQDSIDANGAEVQAELDPQELCELEQISDSATPAQSGTRYVGVTPEGDKWVVVACRGGL